MSADFIERFRLKPSHITAECDPAVLLEWRGELVRIIKEISFQLDELGDGPFVNERWLAKAHFARRANFDLLRKVCRRLSDLGELPESPSLAEIAARVHGLEQEAETARRTIADLQNQLAQARAQAKAQKAEKAQTPQPPAAWELQKANYEQKIANLNKSLALAVEGKKAEKARIANERAESVSQQFVALMKDRLPADEFLSLISAAELAASVQRAA